MHRDSISAKQSRGWPLECATDSVRDRYDDIQSVRLDDKTALVSADYFNDADVMQFSRYVCLAVAGMGSALDGELDVVVVLDQRDVPITECGPRTPPS